MTLPNWTRVHVYYPSRLYYYFFFDRHISHYKTADRKKKMMRARERERCVGGKGKVINLHSHKSQRRMVAVVVVEDQVVSRCAVTTAAARAIASDDDSVEIIRWREDTIKWKLHACVCVRHIISFSLFRRIEKKRNWSSIDSRTGTRQYTFEKEEEEEENDDGRTVIAASRTHLEKVKYSFKRSTISRPPLRWSWHWTNNFSSSSSSPSFYMKKLYTTRTSTQARLSLDSKVLLFNYSDQRPDWNPLRLHSTRLGLASWERQTWHPMACAIYILPSPSTLSDQKWTTHYFLSLSCKLSSVCCVSCAFKFEKYQMISSRYWPLQKLPRLFLSSSLQRI